MVEILSPKRVKSNATKRTRKTKKTGGPEKEIADERSELQQRRDEYDRDQWRHSGFPSPESWEVFRRCAAVREANVILDMALKLRTALQKFLGSEQVINSPEDGAKKAGIALPPAGHVIDAFLYQARGLEWALDALWAVEQELLASR